MCVSQKRTKNNELSIHGKKKKKTENERIERILLLHVTQS